MPHLETPRSSEWKRRRDWYEAQEEDACFRSGLAISEQGCALADAVGEAYCAGAWLAATRLALDIVDARPAGSASAGTDHAQARPATAPTARPARNRARQKVGDLVHLGLDSPQRVVDDHWRGTALEDEAREVIQLMFRCLYPVPQPALSAGAYHNHSDGTWLPASPG